MRVDSGLTGNLQDALSKGVLKRLPLTFLPFVNQQLNQWEFLFPNERKSTERLLLFVGALTPDESTKVFQAVVELEGKMGVSQWQFSTNEQTIQNSSELAKSPYFQEWRRAVQAVFDEADKHAVESSGAGANPRNRLVLLNIPRPLPVDSEHIWRRWNGIGRVVRLDLAKLDQGAGSFDLLLNGMGGGSEGSGVSSPGLLSVVRMSAGSLPADTWVVEAGRGLTDTILDGEAKGSSGHGAILLSYGRLEQYRQNFSREMNTMHKDLADADAVFDQLRKVEVTPWCPSEVAADATVREFVRSLYLSGNGAVIFGNSFVQWAASEALRRARPRLMAAQFGMRSKPKPFTGVAVFDNPDKVNPLPAVDDLPGSAVDAQMLALYVWLAAARYEEYQHSTVCVCIAESLSQAYVIAPPEFALHGESEQVPLEHLLAELRLWIA